MPKDNDNVEEDETSSTQVSGHSLPQPQHHHQDTTAADSTDAQPTTEVERNVTTYSSSSTATAPFLTSVVHTWVNRGGDDDDDDQDEELVAVANDDDHVKQARDCEKMSTTTTTTTRSPLRQQPTKVNMEKKGIETTDLSRNSKAKATPATRASLQKQQQQAYKSSLPAKPPSLAFRSPPMSSSKTKHTLSTAGNNNNNHNNNNHKVSSAIVQTKQAWSARASVASARQSKTARVSQADEAENEHDVTPDNDEGEVESSPLASGNLPSSSLEPAAPGAFDVTSARSERRTKGHLTASSAHRTTTTTVACAQNNDDNDEAQYQQSHGTHEEQQQQRKSPWCRYKRLFVVAIMAIAIVVVVVSLLLTGNDDGGTSNTQPISNNAPCYKSTAAIVNTVLRPRRDFSTLVDIEICPKATLLVQASDLEPILDLRPALAAQSNLRIKCGPHGALEDECVINGYGVNQYDQLLVNERLFQEPAATNMVVEGITFQSGGTIMRMLNAGNITFRNCLFRDTVDFVPFLIAHNGEELSTHQTVTFEGCIFENMKYGHPRIPYTEDLYPTLELETQYENFATLFLVTFTQNTIFIRNCIFRNNQATDTPPGALITSLGGTIHVENSCFMENHAGIAPIVLDKNGEAQVTLIDVYLSEKFASATCPLVAERDATNSNQPIFCLSDEAAGEACPLPLTNFTANW